jgi:hypothetical protein
MGDDIPPVLDDPLLGHLEWDQKLEWWTGSVEFTPGHAAAVFLTHDFDRGRVADEIAVARRGLGLVREREREFRRWSADQFHETRWNTDEPMTRVEIAELLRIATVEFQHDGSIRIYWDDGDQLFWGHNVFTDINPVGECVRAGME